MSTTQPMPRRNRAGRRIQKRRALRRLRQVEERLRLYTAAPAAPQDLAPQPNNWRAVLDARVGCRTDIGVCAAEAYDPACPGFDRRPLLNEEVVEEVLPAEIRHDLWLVDHPVSPLRSPGKPEWRLRTIDLSPCRPALAPDGPARDPRAAWYRASRRLLNI